MTSDLCANVYAVTTESTDETAAIARAAAPPWFRAALGTTAEISEIEVDGTTVRARCWGSIDDPGVVLVHGGAAHARWWDHIGPLLADRHRIVAVDLSGHGDSGWRADYSLSTWGREVVEQAALAAPAGPPVVVGHSMGGYVALTAAVERPDDVASTLLIDSPLPSPTPEGVMSTERMTTSPPRPRRTFQEAMSRFRVIPDDPYVLDFVMEHVAEHSLVRRADGWIWKFDPDTTRRDRYVPMSLLDRAPRPTTVFRAENGLVGPELGQAMCDALGRSIGRSVSLVTIPGTGHHVPLDAPLELAHAILRVLDQGAGSRSR